MHAKAIVFPQEVATVCECVQFHEWFFLRSCAVYCVAVRVCVCVLLLIRLGSFWAAAQLLRWQYYVQMYIYIYNHTYINVRSQMYFVRNCCGWRSLSVCVWLWDCVVGCWLSFLWLDQHTNERTRTPAIHNIHGTFGVIAARMSRTHKQQQMPTDGK